MAVSGEIIAIEKANDTYQNLIIWVVFTDDSGKEISFFNSTGLIEKDGRKAWPLLCKWENFVGRTAAEVEAWVKANVDAQCENIIKLQARPAVNDMLVTGVLASLIGKTWTKETATIEDTILVDGKGAVVK